MVREEESMDNIYLVSPPKPKVGSITSDGSESRENGQNNQEQVKEKAPVYDYEKRHHRFTDRGFFDVILTQLVEIMNLLLQTNCKEFITEFIRD